MEALTTAAAVATSANNATSTGGLASVGSLSPRSSKAPSPASSPVSLMSPNSSNNSNGSPRPPSPHRQRHSTHSSRLASPPLDIMSTNGGGGGGHHSHHRTSLDSPPPRNLSRDLPTSHYPVSQLRGPGSQPLMGSGGLPVPSSSMASLMCGQGPSAMRTVFPSLYSPLSAKEATGFGSLASGLNSSLNSYMCGNPLSAAAFYGSAFSQASHAYATAGLFGRGSLGAGGPGSAGHLGLGHQYSPMSLLNSSALSRAWLGGRPRSPPNVQQQMSSNSLNSSGGGGGCPRSPMAPAMSRSPGQPLSCPLCGASLEGQDVAGHFYEEVHKMETLRKLNDWESSKELHSNDLKRSADTDLDSDPDPKRRFMGDKMQPCTRWQTYQRVRSNRHTRLSGLFRCNKRYQGESDSIKSEMSSSKSPLGSPVSMGGGGHGHSLGQLGLAHHHHSHHLGSKGANGAQRIWSIVGDIQVQPT